MATRYWVGGTGNWDAATTTNWSATSGGAGGASVPTSADNVIFNSSSHGSGYTCTVTVTANCADITFANPATGTLTFAGTSALNVFGSFTIQSAISRTYTGRITFSATTTGHTITMNGISLAPATDTTFNGVGGGWTLQDNFNTGATAIVLTAGELDTNGVTVTSLGFSSTGVLTRSLILGATTWNSTGDWVVTNINGITISAASSTINITATNRTIGSLSGLAGFTFGTVVLSGGGTITIRGRNTFNNLTITGAANATGIVNFTNDSQTVTGTFTVNGNSAINRVILQPATVVSTSTVTITAGATSLSNCDFMDINGAGAAAWSGTSIGDAGGNTGITFTTPVTRYGVAAGNWNSTATWSATSGGASGASVPLCHDDVVLNGSSGAGTYTANRNRSCRNLTCTGFTGTLSISTNTSIYGNLTLVSGMTLSGTSIVSFAGRGTQTITTGTKTITFPSNFVCKNGTYTLQDVFTTNSTITLTAGTFDTGTNYNISCTQFLITGSITKTLNMNASTVTCTGTGTAFGFSSVASRTNSTVNAGTSVINFTNTSATQKTFAGNSFTYYKLQFTGASSGVYNITGDNYFNEIQIVNDGRTLQLAASSTQVVTGTLDIAGTSGNINTIQTPSVGISAALVNSTGSNITLQYVNLRDIVAAGANTMAAGTGSTFTSGNWLWSDITDPDRYWVSGGTGNWNSTTNWSTSSGGASGASVPSGHNVFMDANSGSGITTVNAVIVLGNLDCTGFTGRIAGSSALSVRGSVTLSTGMTITYTGTLTMQVSAQTKTLTSAGKTFPGVVTLQPSVSGRPLDTVTLQDDFISSNAFVVNTNFDANNYNVTALRFIIAQSLAEITINMGSGTWESTTTTASSAWSFTGSTNNTGGTSSYVTTLNAGTSTLRVTGSTANARTLALGDATYNKIWVSNATSNGLFIFTGETSGYGYPVVIGELECSSRPQTLQFTQSTTTVTTPFHITTFTASGTAGNLITINSSTATVAASIQKLGGGTVSCDYLDIRDSYATPSSTWYAGANSTDSGNNSGWIFTAPPGGTDIQSFNGLAYASTLDVNGLDLTDMGTFNGLA